MGVPLYPLYIENSLSYVRLTKKYPLYKDTPIWRGTPEYEGTCFCCFLFQASIAACIIPTDRTAASLRTQKHSLWTIVGPDSSYSPFEIHICWSVVNLVPARIAKCRPPSFRRPFHHRRRHGWYTSQHCILKLMKSCYLQPQAISRPVFGVFWYCHVADKSGS